MIVGRRDQHADEQSSLVGSRFDIPDYPHPRNEAPDLIDVELTDLDDRDLIQLLQSLTAWQDYAATILAAAQVTERRLEDEMLEIKALALVRNWGGGKEDRVRITEAERDSSPEVHDKRQELLDAYAVRKRLEVRTEAFARDGFAVSRELTRRLGMEPQQRRERRYGSS